MAFTLKEKSSVPALPETTSAHDALSVAKLVDGENFYGGLRTIVTRNGWRIDRQKCKSTHTNLQIQRNGVGFPSSVACVLVPIRYSDELQAVPAGQRREGMSTELGRAINKGFHLSEKSRRPAADGGFKIKVYEVLGEYSS
jgi:hypothetical protein